MIFFRSFQSRILFFFLGLFILVQAIILVFVNSANTESAVRQIRNELSIGGRIFNRLLKDRTDNTTEAARLLSGDFAFKTAFASGDRPTLISAMDNHRMRISADVMMLVSMDGQLIADTNDPESTAPRFPLPDLIHAAEKKGVASSIVFLGNHPYQMTVVPLMAPVPVAWICMGFTIDDLLARDLQALTYLNVSFVQEYRNRQPKILASTLSENLRDMLISRLPSVKWESNNISLMTLGNGIYVSLSLCLNKTGDSTVTVILQRSMEEALKPFYRLHHILITLFIGGLLISLVGGVLIARTVTRPVRILADAAHKIEQGDYTHKVDVTRHDELGQLASAFNYMISAISKREKEIKYQAYHDNLTGLPNRSFLHDQLNEAIDAAREKNKPLALLMMDIDRFKDVNAVLGHQNGDTILKKIGTLLTDTVEPTSILARMGGDEFAILLLETNGLQYTLTVVQNIMKALESHFLIDGNPIQVEASFGIVMYPEYGNDADTLIKLADVAMYKAKGSMNGFSVYSPDIDQHSLRQLLLLGELRRGIESEEMTFFYQPKVSFTSGRIVGMEALLRWNHPRHGFIPPDEFIPVLEKTGFIKPLTMWTLKAAITQCSEFNKKGILLDMAVNLSARMLLDPQIPDSIDEMIRTFNLQPEQIIIEVTESAVMADPERTMITIKGLDEIGVRLCVDDFGTGYSSMSYLQKLPVDELKIDKSFVLNMDKNINDATIVQSVIDLGHNLGLKVVAEGVENRQTWDMLQSRGCDVAQGYFMSKPIPMIQLMDWLKNSQWGLNGGV